MNTFPNDFLVTLTSNLIRLFTKDFVIIIANTFDSRHFVTVKKYLAKEQSYQ